MHTLFRLLLATCLFAASSGISRAYSVFTHQQLIDLTWKALLQPMILKRFPQTTKEELQLAHSYAYGGCTIQDLGYYPFANEFFSDLTHYVRSGDFIANLLRDARNANEYAFALGALSHYVGDTIGHQDAINLATALAFPKLAKKYGPAVTYDENPHAHVRIEFAFDIDQLSKQHMAPGAYLRFIGLRVPYDRLDQAFKETYSLRLRDILGRRRPSVRSYRGSVRSSLPRIAHAETLLHRNAFPPDDPNDEASKLFLDRIAQADFQPVWNQYRHKAGIQTHLIAALIFVLPKVGPLSMLAIKIPTEHTQELYVTSMNRSFDSYRGLLRQLAATRDGLTEPLANLDLDTGEKTRPGAYAFTDKTYARLLHKITTDPQTSIRSDLKQNILDFYSDPSAPIATKKNPKAWAQVMKDLDTLRSMPPGGDVANF